MAALPPELTDRIVDHLSDSPHALAACALASRTLLQRARFNAFRTLSVTSPGRRVRLAEVLSADPALAKYTRSLSLTCWDDRPLAGLEHATFPALRTFSLQLYRPPIRDAGADADGPGRKDDCIAGVVALLERTPGLQHLKLWDCAFCPVALHALLDTCVARGVNRLSLVDSYAFEGPGEAVVQPLRLDFPRIHISALTATTVDWLVRAPPARLRALSFAYSGSDDGQRVRTMLRALPELEHLRIEFGQREAFQLAYRYHSLDLTHLTALHTLYLHVSLPTQASRADSFTALLPRLLSHLVLPEQAPRIVLHVATYVHDPRYGPDPVAAPDVGKRTWAPLVRTLYERDAYESAQDNGAGVRTTTRSGDYVLNAKVDFLVDFHRAASVADPTVTASVGEWARGCPAKKAGVEVRWRKGRVPAYGLEERFMQMCEGV